MNKLDISDFSFAFLTLVMLLHYLVKCRSHSLAIYNNEFILCKHKLWLSYCFGIVLASDDKHLIKILRHLKGCKRNLCEL